MRCNLAVLHLLAVPCDAAKAVELLEGDDHIDSQHYLETWP